MPATTQFSMLSVLFRVEEADDPRLRQSNDKAKELARELAQNIEQACRKLFIACANASVATLLGGPPVMLAWTARVSSGPEVSFNRVGGFTSEEANVLRDFAKAHMERLAPALGLTVHFSQCRLLTQTVQMLA